MFFTIILKIWSLIIQISAPFLILMRLKKGLESPVRYKERYGVTDIRRPQGDLIWFHGASVGESLSILPLIQKITEHSPATNFLLTTTTTAAQKVLNSRINKNTIHQFVPFDAIQWVNKFLDHWQPKAVFFIESEIWPNILWQTNLRNIPITLLNARLSETSLINWLRVKKISKKMWGCFSGIYTQSDLFTERFHKLGAINVKTVGNIKLLSEKLPFDEIEFAYWEAQIKGRLCWVAASTHEGEEEIIFKVHQALKKDLPNLLTIVVPRHVDRCDKIISKAKDVKISRFTEKNLRDEDILLVDAMSKLGIFYRLTTIAFIGGSLVPVGGHNPLEPVMLGAFPLWGPYFFNVNDMMYLFDSIQYQQKSVDQLIDTLRDFLKNPEKIKNLNDELQQRVASSQQLIDQKINEIFMAI